MRSRVLLSRAAEAIFWLNRYVERAENTARTIEVNLNLTLDMRQRGGDQWAPLYQISGEDEEFLSRYDAATAANVMRYLTFDETNPNSIASCLWQARENARSIRETISSELFEQLNRFYLTVKAAAESSRVLVSPQEFYTNVRMTSHLLEGLAYATMSHGEAWQFASMGRMLERADQISRILDVKYFILLPTVESVGSPIDDVQWTAVLKSCSGFEMYRKEYGRLVPDRIVEFLMLNSEFPRSILHCVNAAMASLERITGSPPVPIRHSSQRRLGQLQAELAYAEVPNILAAGLHEYLDQLQAKLNEVGEAIYQDFFAPIELPRPVAPKRAWA